jgi:hypothetical protein
MSNRKSVHTFRLFTKNLYSAYIRYNRCVIPTSTTVLGVLVLNIVLLGYRLTCPSDVLALAGFVIRTSLKRATLRERRQAIRYKVLHVVLSDIGLG